MIRKRMTTLLLLSFAACLASVSAQCLSIVDIVCRISTLSMLCASVSQAGLGTSLDTGNWTVFAPTNQAFFNLGDRLGRLLGNTDVLADVILYHAVDETLFADDLSCSDSLEMASGETSRTECHDGIIYQKGQGNSLAIMPQIVVSNIDACNGVLHFVNEVMLPGDLGPESRIPSGCKTIADIACESSMFSTLCIALRQAGLGSALSSGSWTLFAPTNEAFANLGDTLDAVLADNTLLTNILLYHAVDDVVYSSDLECSASVLMAGGGATATVCRAGAIFQTGAANVAGSMPQIVLPDIHACNGVIHLVSEVLLPDLDEPESLIEPEETTQPEEIGCRSIAEIACSTDNFSTLCAAVTQAGLGGALSRGSWTVFAPTNMAFANLGSSLDTVLANNDLLTDILLCHAVEDVVYSTDLECSSTVSMANGETTRTVCEEDGIYLYGKGNDMNAMPLIVLVDIEACNGVIHAVDEVILP